MPDIFNCCLLFLCCFEQKYSEIWEDKHWGSCHEPRGRLVLDIPPVQGPGGMRLSPGAPSPTQENLLRSQTFKIHLTVLMRNFLAEVTQFVTVSGFSWLLIYDLGLAQLKCEKCNSNVCSSWVGEKPLPWPSPSQNVCRKCCKDWRFAPSSGLWDHCRRAAPEPGEKLPALAWHCLDMFTLLLGRFLHSTLFLLLLSTFLSYLINFWCIKLAVSPAAGPHTSSEISPNEISPRADFSSKFFTLMEQMEPEVTFPPWKKGQCELWSVLVAQEDTWHKGQGLNDREASFNKRPLLAIHPTSLSLSVTYDEWNHHKSISKSLTAEGCALPPRTSPAPFQHSRKQSQFIINH